MAAQTITDWIPEEFGGAIITQVDQVSTIENVARKEPMNARIKEIPRSAGMDAGGVTPKSTAIPEATGTNDKITLTAEAFKKMVRLADEDIDDEKTREGVVNQKMAEWGRAVAVALDHACLGTSAIKNSGTIPFNSLYYALNTTNAATGYTADANLITTGGAVTYDDLSAAFGLVETSNYWDDADALVIANPAFKAHLRAIKGSDGHPVFHEYSAQAAGMPDRLLGAPIRWTLGARVHATNVSAPTGAPLLFVGNRQHLVLGIRSPYESMYASADSGPAFGTDEALLKMRVRRAFAVSNENAWACIEYTAS